MTSHYEYWEDGAGGLHLFVLADDGKVIDGVTSLEYARPGEWNDVKDALDEDPALAIETWEGHMREHEIDPQEFYREVVENETGYELVCKDGRLFPELMGRAACLYFDIHDD